MTVEETVADTLTVDFCCVTRTKACLSYDVEEIKCWNLSGAGVVVVSQVHQSDDGYN